MPPASAPQQQTAAERPRTWFDAHLDLAYLAVNGRDMLAPLNPATPPHPPAACTLPSLRDGGVRLCLATIFTEPIGPADRATGPEAYPVGDTARAFAAGRAQLEAYLTWQDRGQLTLDLRRALSPLSGVGHVRAAMGVSSVEPLSPDAMLARLPRPALAPSATPQLRAGILIENAEPIRSPDDVPFWVERGVLAVGLAWARSSRYAGGNSTHDPISDLGKHLVRALDHHRVVHDASHLSDRAFNDLLDLTDRTIIASHSNCRAIVDPSGQNQRHLSDEQIRAIASRGGVVGINLYSKFLTPDLADTGRAPISDVVRHIEHIAEIAQPVSPFNTGRAHVALGTDLDGGFSAARLPHGIDTPRDYHRLADALADRGWSADHIAGFAFANWLRTLAESV